MIWQENLGEAKKILIQLKQLDLPREKGEGWYNRDVNEAAGEIVQYMMELLKYDLLTYDLNANAWFKFWSMVYYIKVFFLTIMMV